MASLFPYRWLHYTFFKTIIRRRFPSQNSSSSFPKCPRIFPNMPPILPGMFPSCSVTSPSCPVMFQISSQNGFKREEKLPQNGFKPPKSNQNRVKLSIFVSYILGRKPSQEAQKFFYFFALSLSTATVAPLLPLRFPLVTPLLTSHAAPSSHSSPSAPLFPVSGHKKRSPYQSRYNDLSLCSSLARVFLSFPVFPVFLVLRTSSSLLAPYRPYSLFFFFPPINGSKPCSTRMSLHLEISNFSAERRNARYNISSGVFNSLHLAISIRSSEI